jgi:lambda family phage minor tail protein L
MSAPIGDLQAVAPSSIIELFEIQLVQAIHGATTTYRFHPGTNAFTDNGSIKFGGLLYTAFPLEVDGLEYSGNGQLPRPKLRASNVLGTITSILLNLPQGLEGAKFTRIRTLARYLDAANFPTGNANADPTATFPAEIYYIDRKSAETRDFVEFELCAAFDLIGVRAPKRQCISNICQWVYRSAECSYTGTGYYAENDTATSQAQDVCGKKLSSCKVRFGATAQLPFGSFPAVGTFNV